MADILQRVTDRRLRFLHRAYQRLGYSPERALRHAQLTYYAYVGFLQLAPQGMSPAPDTLDYELYIEHIIEVLLRADRTGA
jgi:hypothetical protein